MAEYKDGIVISWGDMYKFNLDSLLYYSYDDMLKDFNKHGHNYIINKYCKFLLSKHTELSDTVLKKEIDNLNKLFCIDRSIIMDFWMLEADANSELYKIYTRIYGEIKPPNLKDIELCNS